MVSDAGGSKRHRINGGGKEAGMCSINQTSRISSLPPSLPPGYKYDLLDIARHVASLLLATVPLLLVIIQNAGASEGAEVTVRKGGRERGREERWEGRMNIKKSQLVAMQAFLLLALSLLLLLLLFLLLLLLLLPLDGGLVDRRRHDRRGFALHPPDTHGGGPWFARVLGAAFLLVVADAGGDPGDCPGGE